VPRPPKCRRVAFMPGVAYFKPAGVPMRLLEEVRLSVEELEAVRLRDLEDLEQEVAGERMNVSRATFQRILESARRKLADALLNGKAIRIQGGRFEMASRRFRCVSGHEWEMPFEALVNALPETCPTCATRDIAPLLPAGFGHCRGGRGRQGTGPSRNYVNNLVGETREEESISRR
jgi:predicted DNA-binding protein (UPF0251 family)